MSKEPKVYVINPDKTSDPRKIIERTVKPAPETNTNNSSRPRKESNGDRSVRDGSLPGVLLSYLLGPLSILTTREGRTSKLWVALALGSVAVTLSFLLGWSNILSKLGEKGYVILPLMLVTSISILIGFTVWARAIHTIGRHRALLPQNLPDPLRRPGLIGMLGFLFPGMGLLVTGHHRRASFTVWLTGLLALSLFVLSRAAWLWSWNKGAGSEALQGKTLEYLFIVMGIVAAFGVLVWIVQALDGARLAERRFVQNRRTSGGTAAFALLASILLFVLVFEPASVADTLDNLAVSAQQEGYRLLPLHAELAAMQLDPSRPAFTVEAAELYDRLGEHESARALRDDLFDRWRPCMVVMKQHGMLDPYIDSRTNVTEEVIAEESPDDGETVNEKTIDKEAGISPWDRIRSEYGLFTAPLERGIVMLEGI